MRSAAAIAASTLISVIPAQKVEGVVQWDIHRRELLPGRGLRRRAQTVEEVINNEKLQGGYFATCAVGTPPQGVTLQLDTGSSDTWVPWAGANVCSLRFTREGCSLGSFNNDESDTFGEVGAKKTFAVKYLDGSYSNGDYFSDTLEIGGVTVTNLTMGLGRNTTVNHGLVGIGYQINEAMLRTADTPYPNLPVKMMDDGLVNTVAYSLWLNDLSANTGNILFGGVDKEKYVGDLTRIKILPDDSANGLFTHFTVPLTKVQATSPSGSDTLTSNSFPIPVILDSGTTLSYLPNDIARQIWREAGAEYLPLLEEALIPCRRRNSPGTFEFGFAGPDGPKIKVGMDELVLDRWLDDPPPFPGSSKFAGQAACLFGIQNTSQDTYLLGDTFLRSAYVVYDLENNEIGFAQTDFNDTKSDIVAFPSKGATIPGAKEVQNQGLTDTPASTTEPSFAAEAGFSNAGMTSATPWMGVALMTSLGVAAIQNWIL